MDEREQLHEAMQRMPQRVGERLCLDFMNTIEPRGGPAIVVQLSEQQRAAQREYLANYNNLLAWSVLAGTVKEEEACRLQEQAEHEGTQADEILKQIVVLRETLYTIFWSIATAQTVQKQDLDVLQQAYLDALSHARLLEAKGNYEWRWTVEKRDLRSPIWPVIHSAMQLLTEGDVKRIKVCPGVPGDPVACAWLFYDESKNRTRRWCSMQDCGSRTKARQLTARRRKEHQKQDQ